MGWVGSGQKNHTSAPASRHRYDRHTARVKRYTIIITIFQRLSVLIQRHNAILLHDCFVKEEKVNSSMIFTTRCYASAVLAMGLCPSVCVCVCHKPVFY